LDALALRCFRTSLACQLTPLLGLAVELPDGAP
jgi:hypothetical protein